MVSYLTAFFGGIYSLFSLNGIIFIIITLILSLIGIFKRIKYLIYISLFLTLLIFILNFKYRLFPIGTLTLYQLNVLSGRIVYYMGIISIPLIVNIIGLIKRRRLFFI